MIQAFGAFAKQLLTSGGFKVSEFPSKAYRELLIGFERLQEEQQVILPGMIELAKAHPGYLVVDDTKNPKYGLKHLAKKLKILTNGATRTGYDIVLLLWLVPGMGRFPLVKPPAPQNRSTALIWEYAFNALSGFPLVPILAFSY